MHLLTEREDPLTNEESRPLCTIREDPTTRTRETEVENGVLSREIGYQIQSMEHREKELLTREETRLTWRDTNAKIITDLVEKRITPRPETETILRLHLEAQPEIILHPLIMPEEETFARPLVRILRPAENASSITNAPIIPLRRHPVDHSITRRPIVKRAILVTRIVRELITTTSTREVATRAVCPPEVSSLIWNVRLSARDRDLVVGPC